MVKAIASESVGDVDTMELNSPPLIANARTQQLDGVSYMRRIFISTDRRQDKHEFCTAFPQRLIDDQGF